MGITYWAAKRTRTTKEFYAAGRSVTGFQNGLALAGGFLAAVAVSLMARERPAEGKFAEQKLRSYVGVGAE